jgi:hypothetical protein
MSLTLLHHHPSPTPPQYHHQVPVSTDDPIQSKKLFSSAGKGFDPRAKIIYLYKPLKKIQVRNTGRVAS